MKFGKTAKAVAIAVAVGMSSHVMAASTNLWWSIDFNSVASITTLTNDTTGGVWKTVDGDLSSITNTIPGNATKALKLDTQGNNLTWKPTTASTSTVVLVDAEIYLVGSDTAPAGFDNEAAKVQTAVYLKNYLNANNEPTNSVLCAYVSASESSNKWVELQGSMIDTNWYTLRIEVDYSGAGDPVAKFIVGGIVKQDSTSATSFTIANYNSFNTTELRKVNSVSFRGTGAVDNFVGNQVVPAAAVMLTFDVTTLVTNEVIAVETMADGTAVEAGIDWVVTFAESDGAGNFLTVVRVYTNATEYVDYNATRVAQDNWTFDAVTLLSNDPVNGSVKLTIPTTEATPNHLKVEAYYGEAPTGGPTNPDPQDPAVIGGAITGPATAFEMIGDPGVEYFSVTFLAPEAGIQYTLCTSTTLVAPASFVASEDALATAKSDSIGEQITLKAPTGGAPTMFYVIKASTYVPPAT